LNENLYRDLEKISKKTSKSKKILITKAIEQFVEDIKDVEDADEIMKKEKPDTWISHDKVKKNILDIIDHRKNVYR
jgi:predicted DNA-binding protein